MKYLGPVPMVFAILFTIIHLVIAGIFIYRKDKQNTLETVGITLALWGYYIVADFFQIKMPFIYFALVYVVTIMHLLIGYGLNFYEKTKWFDRGLHFYGSFSFALFAYANWTFFTPLFEKAPFERALFLIILAGAIGAVYEVSEFVQDTFFQTNKQQGLQDTDVDLMADLFGGLLAGILLIFIL